MARGQSYWLGFDYYLSQSLIQPVLEFNEVPTKALATVLIRQGASDPRERRGLLWGNPGHGQLRLAWAFNRWHGCVS
jgi:hypothetical protein